MDEKMNYQELENGAAAQEGTSAAAQEAIAEETPTVAGEETGEGSEVTSQEEINEADGEPIYHANEGEE